MQASLWRMRLLSAAPRTALAAPAAIRRNIFLSGMREQKKSLVPPPSWSLEDLQLTTVSDKTIVTHDDVLALCKLSCVNLDYSNATVQSVVDDINVILRCADSIKENDGADLDSSQNRMFTLNKLEMGSLRDDTVDTTNNKEALLSHATGRIDNYYSVPKVNSRSKHNK